MKHPRGRIILIAYDFPPRVRSGSFRPLRFARTLAASGWKVVVLTASELEDKRPVDDSLLGEWADSVEVGRVFSVSSLLQPIQEAFSRVGIGGLVYRSRKMLLFPDEKILWACAVVLRLLRMRVGPDDIVLTTSPPWSVHLAGLLLRRVRGTKWVADHRDPWTFNPHFRGKGPVAGKLHKYFEGMCHNHSDAIITASQMQRDQIVESFEIDGDRVVALYSGYDGADFEHPGKSEKRRALEEELGQDAYIIMYAGACYQDYFPRVFLEGLATAAVEDTAVRERVRVVFFLSDDGDRMKKECSWLGLNDMVTVRPAVRHADLPGYLLAADCLLLYVPETGNSEAWVPGKTFEYLGSGRPIMAIVPLGGEVAALMRENGRGAAVSPSEPGSVKDMLKKLVRSESAVLEEQQVEVKGLEWSVLAGKLTGLMDSLRTNEKLSVALAAPGLGIVDRGVERFTEELGKSLGAYFDVSVYGGGGRGNGHRNIVCLSRNNRVTRAVEDMLPSGLQRVIRRLHLDTLEIERLTFSLGVLGALVRKSHHVLIQSGGFWGAFFSRIAGRILGIKVISIGHGGLGGAVEDLTFLSDHYVTVNPIILDDLKSNFPGRDISFLPTTVDTEQFRPAGAYLDLDLERPVYLTVGALEEGKRIDLAIRAVARLNAGSLLVVGSGPLEEKLRELGNSKLGSHRFRLVHTPKEHMVQYYNASDVFTMPSEREAFSLALFEALACDLPVVTVREGARALFGDKCIIYCEPSDEVQYAEALRKALSRMGSGIMRDGVMEYSSEKISARWAGLIQEVAGR